MHIVLCILYIDYTHENVYNVIKLRIRLNLIAGQAEKGEHNGGCDKRGI